MSLRFKLLLIALSTLALPWAGWQFVRQMEQLLRQGQEQALTASAKALARSLVASQLELPPIGTALYAHQTSTPMLIDGFADDWALLMPYAQNLGPGNDPQKLRILLSSDTDWFYLLAQIHDSTRVRADARDPNATSRDHLILSLGRGSAVHKYLIASAAPGAFEAISLTAEDALPSTLSGEWQEEADGYRIELRLPHAQRPDRLGLAVFDAPRPKNSLSAMNDDENLETYPLIHFSTRLSQGIAPFAPADVRVRLLNSEAWVIAKSGELSAANDPKSSRLRWLENLIYRGLIAPGFVSARDFDPALPRLNTAEVWQALSGIAASAWHPAEREGAVVLTVAIPLQTSGNIQGALLLEQASDALPLLTNRALLSLVGVSFLVVLIAGVVLFLFASVLSLRIRRLRDATERALRSDGRTDTHFPMTSAQDELGDLSRSFGKLLEEIDAYTDYLRTLASKLSHELNTPLAIVKSSLDNLEHQEMPSAAQPYLLRAREGAERIGVIVRMMSEARRMERAIASAEGEDFDLRAVIRGCVEAYRVLVGTRELRCELPTHSALMYGAPELIAQALDKLFDNALSFTPPEGWIAIALMPTSGGMEITVANNGPLLPETMQDRLFDTLVSMRDPSVARSHGDAPHLGFGLYIVRLVAELHAGNAAARNLDTGNGVEFRITLKGMPRKRLVNTAPR